MTRSLRILSAATLACFLALLGAPDRAVGADPIVRKCAKRVVKSVMSYAEDYLGIYGDCHIENLKDDENLDCAVDADLLDDALDKVDKAKREVAKCDTEALRAICPLGGKTDETFGAALLGGPGDFSSKLEGILEEVFVEETPGCPRPPPLVQVPSKPQDCAKRLAFSVQDGAVELEKCFFGCMQAELQAPLDEPCIDEVTGLANPNNRKITSCITKAHDDFMDSIPAKCTDAYIQVLGCPMGASSVLNASTLLWARISAEVRAANLGIFVSPCKTTFDGPGSEPGTAIPANVTLFPSLTTKQVSCGAVLDSAFFGSDTTVRFDTDLDCGPIAAPTDGIIVAKSGVTIDGDSQNRILTGPLGGANRTGTGIRLASGVTGVHIKDFKAIEFFGVGVKDAGNNTDANNIGPEIDRITVRRNTIAGILMTSPGADLEDVVADRNVIGFDLSGDDTQLRKPRARRSGPLPGYGVYLHGTDVNGNGRAVRVSEGTIEDNIVGVWADGQGHRIEENEIDGNSVQGVVLAGTGCSLKETAIKFGLADGVLVSGTSNTVSACRSEQNVGDGYVVTGSGNTLDGNGSGALTDLGNGGVGFVVDGTGNTLRTNRAEANGGSGYEVSAANTISSNDARSNQGTGFSITGSGVGLDTNVGESNGGFEFDIAPNNLNLNGNRANGATFSFGAAGGKFE